MKRILLLLTTLFAFLSGQAQIELSVFGIGQNTVITNNHKTSIPVVKNKATFSSSFGAQVTHYTKSNFGFGLGLMYTAHNQKFDVISPLTGDVMHYGKKRFDYLKVSALLQYRVVYDERFNYFFYGGPQILFLVKADGTLPVYFTYPPEDNYFYYDLPDVTNAYANPFVFEITVGTGFEYKLNKNLGLQAGFRFDYGLSDVENKNYFKETIYDSYGRTNEVGKTTPFALGITYGVIFHFGGDHLISPSQKFGHKSRAKYKR